MNQGKSALVGGVVGGLTYPLVVIPFKDGDMMIAGIGFVVASILATLGFWLFVPGEEIEPTIEAEETD